MHLMGKKILLTGASNGLGMQLTLLLAEERCKLFLVDIDAQGLMQLQTKVAVSTTIYTCNMQHEAERRKLVQWVNEQGGVDILINCAGVGSHSLLKKCQ
jgi:short-subunit dehydrogenase